MLLSFCLNCHFYTESSAQPLFSLWRSCLQTAENSWILETLEQSKKSIMHRPLLLCSSPCHLSSRLLSPCHPSLCQQPVLYADIQHPHWWAETSSWSKLEQLLLLGYIGPTVFSKASEPPTGGGFTVPITYPGLTFISSVIHGIWSALRTHSNNIVTAPFTDLMDFLWTQGPQGGIPFYAAHIDKLLMSHLLSLSLQWSASTKPLPGNPWSADPSPKDFLDHILIQMNSLLQGFCNCCRTSWDLRTDPSTCNSHAVETHKYLAFICARAEIDWTSNLNI